MFREYCVNSVVACSYSTRESVRRVSCAGGNTKLLNYSSSYMAKRAVISPFLSIDELNEDNKPKGRPDVRGQVGYYRELAGVDAVPSDDEVRYIYSYLASYN